VLAHMFGASAVLLPGGMKLKLQSHVDAIKAMDRLESGNTNGLKRDEFMALVELATGSRKIAEDAARRRMAAQMDAGVKPT